MLTRSSKRTKQNQCACGLLCVYFCLGSVALGLTNRISATTSGGGWTTNATWQNYAILGAPSDTTRLSTSTRIVHTGLANTFLLAPHIDTDNNGIPDENDPDNEGDLLSDLAELTGSEFSPVTITDPLLADTDSDGVTDADEAVMGTDPTDAYLYLKFTNIGNSPNDAVLGWIGREGYGYDILAATSAVELASTPVLMDHFTGGAGAGPWQLVYMVYSNIYQPRAFYSVRVTGH